jgi:hypothetical protein
VPLERADVLRVRHLIPVEVRHHVVKFGRVMLAESRLERLPQIPCTDRPGTRALPQSGPFA